MSDEVEVVSLMCPKGTGWAKKTIECESSALDKINLRRIMGLAPNVSRINRKMYLVKYRNVTLIFKHSRQKVLLKRLRCFYEDCLRDFGAIIGRSYPAATFDVVCDRTNNSGEDVRNGVLNVTISVNTGKEEGNVTETP